MKLILLTLMALNASAYNLSDVVDKLIIIESNGDSKAIGDNGRALGCLQIWKIMVDECNRITGGKMAFTYDDRNNTQRSKQMALTFLNKQMRRYYSRYNKLPSEELLANSWNRGSIFKSVNENYVRKYRRLK
jgi:hypothetical protein